MISMIDLAGADGGVDESEAEALILAQVRLGVNNDQRAAMENRVRAKREVEARGKDDDKALQLLKSAAAGMTGVGKSCARCPFSARRRWIESAVRFFRNEYCRGNEKIGFVRSVTPPHCSFFMGSALLVSG